VRLCAGYPVASPRNRIVYEFQHDDLNSDVGVYVVSLMKGSPRASAEVMVDRGPGLRRPSSGVLAQKLHNAVATGAVADALVPPATASSWSRER
jgi:hypothetical protein